MSKNGTDGPARAGMGLIGSLREALAAASRETSGRAGHALAMPSPNPAALAPIAKSEEKIDMGKQAPSVSAAEAAREARGGVPNIPSADRLPADQDDADRPPTTRVARASPASEGLPRTQFVRGKFKAARSEFQHDPVVGWLVVVGGPGLAAYRPIFEGNNTIGRAANQRIPIDFGDDAISSEEQAYIRYDGNDRSFLFVPNMAKTNVVAINDKRPTTAIELHAMDVITMGRTQLAFVPFCGPEFDWSEIGGKA